MQSFVSNVAAGASNLEAAWSGQPHADVGISQIITAPIFGSVSGTTASGVKVSVPLTTTERVISGALLGGTIAAGVGTGVAALGVAGGATTVAGSTGILAGANALFHGTNLNKIATAATIASATNPGISTVNGGNDPNPIIVPKGSGGGSTTIIGSNPLGNLTSDLTGASVADGGQSLLNTVAATDSSGNMATLLSSLTKKAVGSTAGIVKTSSGRTYVRHRRHRKKMYTRHSGGSSMAKTMKDLLPMLILMKALKD